MRHILHYLFCVCAFVSACGNRTADAPQYSESQVRESLIKANKTLTEREADDIEGYIQRRKLKMEKTGTGLRYQFFRKGSGRKAETGMIARVNYTLSLPDGTVCYSSDSLGTESFLIDKDNVESGLHEGIKLMNEGDRAKFILPSHLAHGLLGDRNCITARTPVIYDIELLEVSDP